jgi:hypothetical protein
MKKEATTIIQTTFNNTREINRFKRYAEKFSTQTEPVEIYNDLQNKSLEILNRLVICAKDPSIGFPKSKTEWANTRRQYRLHWQKMEIEVQSIYKDFENAK